MKKFLSDLRKEYSVLELVKEMSNHWENVSWKKISQSKKSFYESNLLRLNCNKAKKILKWKSVLNFNENIKMVANWYSTFYKNSRNIESLTTEQIKTYQTLAIKRGLNWAKIN